MLRGIFIFVLVLIVLYLHNLGAAFHGEESSASKVEDKTKTRVQQIVSREMAPPHKTLMDVKLARTKQQAQAAAVENARHNARAYLESQRRRGE